MNIQLYQMDKYIKDIVLKEKIPSNTKMLNLTGGADPQVTPKPLITLDTLKNSDLNNSLDKSNKWFIEIIGKYFGNDLSIRINSLLPLVSLYFLDTNTKSGQGGGGRISPALKKCILPIATMIIGYSYKEKLGYDKLNLLAIICFCYCIYLMIIGAGSESNFSVIKQKIKDIFYQFLTTTQDGGSATASDQFGILTMITSGIRWIRTNIESYISESFGLMEDFIKSPNKSFALFNETIIKIFTGARSTLSQELIRSFDFNNSTGHVQFNGPSHYNFVTQIAKKIFIYFNGNKTTYKVNDQEMNTISQIGGKPFATALVFGYMEHMKSLGLAKSLIDSTNLTNATHPSNKYTFELTSDNIVKIYEKDTNKLVESMGTSIEHWAEGDEKAAVQTAQNVCKEMFGIDGSTPTCSKYFYSVLGRSALGMMKVLGAEIKSKTNVLELLKQSNPAIKYEILKSLEWKTDSQRILISLDQWVKIQSQSKPEISTYLETDEGKAIKEILELYIRDVNEWIQLLGTSVSLTPIKTRGPRRLTSAQVAALRSTQISETAKLIDSNLKELYILKPMHGGHVLDNSCVQEFESKLSNIKSKLQGGYKVLSSNTETKIRLLIQKVSELEGSGPVGLYGKKLVHLTNVFGKLESLV